MEKVIDFAGNVTAALGIFICLVAGVARVAGNHYVFGYEAITLFIGGIALMVMACLARLHRLSTTR
ncbi:MAG: hypothetical protein BBJ57_04585 [Desulfobacterales bacterium PC51MH44]|nr:MAG: hypothetical protein BBJ57_04585 [Desulfobacterales bacterium PC51MH44]